MGHMGGTSHDQSEANGAARVASTEAQYDWNETSPSVAILQTLEELDADTSTVQLPGEHATLSDYVDADALDTILDHGETVEEICVSIGDYDVQIGGDGHVSVDTTDISADSD